MTDNSITLEERDDNSTEDAERVVAWVRGFKGADAHIVFDYIAQGGELVPGALNGVTVQWAHTETVIDVEDLDGDGDTTEQIETVALVAGEALHVRPGGTLRRVGKGFEVKNLNVVIPEPAPLSASQVAAFLAEQGFTISEDDQ